MERYLNDLHEMSETLGRALKEANEKIRNVGGKLSPGDMDYVSKLSHGLKSVVTTIAMIEADGMDDGGSYGDGSYRRDYSRDGGSYRDGGHDGGSYGDGSYARGRGRYAKRDSMGRYSSRGYSRDGYSREGGYSGHGDMVDELRELMQDVPDEQTRQEFQRLIQRMEKQK